MQKIRKAMDMAGLKLGKKSQKYEEEKPNANIEDPQANPG